MLKKRLIPSLLVRNGRIVQSANFRHTNVIGNAFTAVDFFNAWAVDEILILDISQGREFRKDFQEIVSGLSKRCFVPLTVGGWIQTIDDIRKVLLCGADKACINTQACKSPEFVGQAAKVFGSQCIVVSMDVRGTSPETYEVYSEHAQTATGRHPVDWAGRVQGLGAGEIYLTSVDHDGCRGGYDLELVRSVCEAVDIPVIAFGGVGHWQHMVDGVTIGQAEAVSAANIFHYTEHSTKKAKEYLIEHGVDMRPTYFYKVNRPRNVKYKINYRV
ncbi:MAG: imidazole glycerol phosphate synthase subunit HisF [Anaerolineaceae bacterium]|nr:imidazole glycerol phosphate synthase subunit HisF [Anaerolineaceae bacterium]